MVEHAFHQLLSSRFLDKVAGSENENIFLKRYFRLLIMRVARWTEGRPMKLAEALILRADCQKRFEQLKSRLLNNARVQEGDKPAEKPQELIAEIEKVATELVSLIKRINQTNSSAIVARGKTISDLLAERDILRLRRTAFADLAASASARQDRYTRSEVKFVATVNVAEFQKRADKLAKDYREMDARIQELNWRTELV